MISQVVILLLEKKLGLGFYYSAIVGWVEKLLLLLAHFVSPQRGGSAEHKKLTSLKRIEAKKMVFSVLLLLLTKKCSTFLWLKHPLKQFPFIISFSLLLRNVADLVPQPCQHGSADWCFSWSLGSSPGGGFGLAQESTSSVMISQFIL